MGGFGVWFFVYSSTGCLFAHSVVPGGGKCPEEEHTTCSGGPTIIVTSAVYGEREIKIKREKRKYKIFYKKENILL